VISKKFGFWCLFGAGLSAAIYGSWHAPFIFMGYPDLAVDLH